MDTQRAALGTKKKQKTPSETQMTSATKEQITSVKCWTQTSGLTHAQQNQFRDNGNYIICRGVQRHQPATLWDRYIQRSAPMLLSFLKDSQIVLLMRIRRPEHDIRLHCCQNWDGEKPEELEDRSEDERKWGTALVTFAKWVRTNTFPSRAFCVS